ncbi:MAG: DUF4837 family protein [Tannerellaceae bacterium]|nr:DUF4837 family protein [Tannerellaceae bacterium]
MKVKDLFFITIFFVTVLAGCSSGAVVTKATGFAYEIIVVMDNSKWNGIAGEVIKDELWASIEGLPQPEPSFKVTHVNPNDFNGLLTYVRNILIVRIDPNQYTKVSVNTENNRWSSGQVVMYLTAPDEETLVEWHQKNAGHISDYFTRVEMDRAAAQLQNTYSNLVLETVQEMFGASLKVPADMTYSKRAEDFFWASNNANTGRTDLVVYSFPYTDANTFTLDYLVAKRDSVLKENLPGAFPDSYMTTETRFELSYKPITVNGEYVGVLRGLWKMVGDMMGGPFVSHVRLDERNNRILVVEGFVYAPETNKRNFIRRIEAALFTLRLQGDAQ